MTTQLVRVSVDLTTLARVAGQRGWTQGKHKHFDEGAALHHLLGETFGQAVLQPFRLMITPRVARATLYAYSQSGRQALQELARATAMPEVETTFSLGDLDAKVMPENWKRAQRLGFDIRVKPIRRLLKDIPVPSDRPHGNNKGFKRGAEIDAFLAEALTSPERDHMANTERSRETVYRDWLAERLGTAASLESARLSSFRRTKVARGSKAVDGPDAVIQGTLRIEDPATFKELLAKGIGRHKAYGFGMLLIRPPDRTNA